MDAGASRFQDVINFEYLPTRPRPIIHNDIFYLHSLAAKRPNNSTSLREHSRKTIVVPYELYDLYDWGKVPELYGTL